MHHCPSFRSASARSRCAALPALAACGDIAQSRLQRDRRTGQDIFRRTSRSRSESIANVARNRAHRDRRCAAPAMRRSPTAAPRRSICAPMRRTDNVDGGLSGHALSHKTAARTAAAMTPAARTQAAIELLDEIIAAARGGGAAADTLIARYFKARRYAGAEGPARDPRRSSSAPSAGPGERPAPGGPPCSGLPRTARAARHVRRLAARRRAAGARREPARGGGHRAGLAARAVRSR